MSKQILVAVVFGVIGLCRSALAQEGLEPLPPLSGAEEGETAEVAPAPAEPPEEEAEPVIAPEPSPVEEAAEETLAEGQLAVRGAASDGTVPEEARDALDAAVAALVAADYETAREMLARAGAALPEEHWLLPTVIKLGMLANAIERGLALGGEVEDESVASLYVTLTLYGFYTGIWLFGILGEMEAQPTVPLSVATAGIGIGVAYMLDHREEPLTGAMADGISAGLTLGAAEGILLLAAINPDDFSEKSWTSMIWASALTGSIIGGYAVHATGASRGDVALSTAGYTWGAVLGLCLAGLVSVD